MAILTLASSTPAALAASPALAWIPHAVFAFGVLGIAITVYLTRAPRTESGRQD